jgi:hypothetical protein
MRLHYGAFLFFVILFCFSSSVVYAQTPATITAIMKTDSTVFVKKLDNITTKINRIDSLLINLSKVLPIDTTPKPTPTKVDRYLILKVDTIIKEYKAGKLNNKHKYHYIDTIINYTNKIDTALKVQRKNQSDLQKQLDGLSKSSMNKNTSKEKDKQEAKTTKDSIDSVKSLLQNYLVDSTLLSTMILGQYNQLGFNASYFQSMPALADDNPRTYSAYHLNVNFPLRKIDGVIKKPSNKTSVILLRNFQASFMGNFSNKNYGANEYVDSNKTTNNKYIYHPYINLLDLSQYAFFTATANLNLLTTIGKHYSWYFDGFFSFSRTNIYVSKDSSKQPTLSSKDSAYAKNIGLYGISITGKTKFKGRLNARINCQAFWIDPATNNNSLSFLNAQYNKITVEAPQSNTSQPISALSDAQKHMYASIKFTLQYNTTPASTSSKSTNSTSSSISGTAPSFLYATFGFTSSLLPKHGHDVNSYMILQIGYSIDIQTIISKVQSISGFNSSTTKQTATN